MARNWQNKEFYERKKVAIRETSERITACLADEKYYLLSTLYSIYYKDNFSYEKNLEYLLAVINSNVAQFFMYHLVFGLSKGAFTKARTNHYQRFPIPLSKREEVTREAIDELTKWVSKLDQFKADKNDINLNLLDYIQPYSDGPALTHIGIYRPPEGVGDTKLTATKDDYENLRIGIVTCEREADNTVVIHATARYKPDDPDAHETDQWGYTETEPMPAMRLSDLSETEADLVEAFVPVAVEEAGGFAGFRETATKTNSLVDRLEAITLPDPDDVADDLQRYREAVERAEELDEKIQRTDDLIDEIVYELYGLTDEEIEIVENAVGD